jgi:hypothetical protein
VNLFQFSAPASEEPAEAIRWYEHRLAGLGGELYDAAAVGLIRTHPETGPPRFAGSVGRRDVIWTAHQHGSTWTRSVWPANFPNPWNSTATSHGLDRQRSRELSKSAPCCAVYPHARATIELHS